MANPRNALTWPASGRNAKKKSRELPHPGTEANCAELRGRTKSWHCELTFTAILFKAMRVFVLLAALFILSDECCFLSAGVVPERAGEVAAHGDEAGEQNGGEVFSGRVAGAGHVPWADGLDPVAAAA